MWYRRITRADIKLYYSYNKKYCLRYKLAPMPTKRGPCLRLESMWISDDKNIKRQMGTKASAWVSNKAVELNGKQKEGKVREPEGHRQGWRLRQNKWG
jgi:hypothetical protein